MFEVDRGAAPAAIAADAFRARMARLGPWGKGLAVAVSGGADSLCLAWLVRTAGAGLWGEAIGLVVDHGLRPASAAEAQSTVSRLASFGMASQVLTLRGLAAGPGLAARARAARYRVLGEAMAQLGLSDLLLGHHARDQAETVLMRHAAGSGAAGLAGMAAITHCATRRLVRPLLDMPPGRLRATLAEAGIGWVEDPSNADPAALRTRLRTRLADWDGCGQDVALLAGLAAEAGRLRARAGRAIAATLAARATIHPEGFAILSEGPIAPDALGALIRMVGGSGWAPGRAALARLAPNPVGHTLGGVRLMPAGRFGPGTLLVREHARGPVAACDGAVWDGRFRLAAPKARWPEGWPEGLFIGALGADAPAFRSRSHLPSAVLRTLPALRGQGRICAVPHLGYSAQDDSWVRWAERGLRLSFSPPEPAACGVWAGDA